MNWESYLSRGVRPMIRVEMVKSSTTTKSADSSSNNHVSVHDICGRKLPVGMKGKPQECLDIELNLNYQKGDIMIVTFPKTGTTLLQYICHLLRTRCLPQYQTFEDIHQVCPHSSSAWYVGQDLNTAQNQYPLPRLFKSHRELCQIAPFTTSCSENDIKFIATIRNPLSTLISVFSFGKVRKSDAADLDLIEYANSTKWTQEYNQGCISTVFDTFAMFYQCQMKCNPKNFLLIPYEDLVSENVEDKTKWIELIADFMELPKKSITHSDNSDVTSNDYKSSQLSSESVAQQKSNTTSSSPLPSPSAASALSQKELIQKVIQMTSKQAMMADENIHKFDESWCKKQRDTLHRTHPFIQAPAAKVTSGHEEIVNKMSVQDGNNIQHLHERLWKEKVENVTGVKSYEEMRRLINEFHFPNS